MTLAERKAALLDQAMALSRQRQDLAIEMARVDQAMLKTAGAIDVVDELLAAEGKADGV